MSTQTALLETLEASWRAAGSPGEVLLALSGGADSTALLHLLLALRETRGITLRAAHVDHGLRETARRDAAFCQALCARLGVPLTVARVRVADAGSPEDAARRARYGALEDALRASGCRVLALAHHADDQAETVLMHLARGSGGAGLRGMLPVRKAGAFLYWRPLLNVSRERLRAYLAARGQSFCEDESNADRAFARNALRAKVMPALLDYAPHARETLGRAAAIFAQEEEAWDACVRDFLRGHASLSPPCRFVMAGPLCERHPAFARRVLRAMAPGMGFAKTEEALACLLGAPGGAVNLPGGGRLLRTRERLHVLPPVPDGAQALSSTWRLTQTEAGGLGDGKYVQAFDAALLEGALLRTRQSGDRIHPLGAPGAQKLKQYLIDRHIDRPFRDYWPVLARGSDILWAPGVGAAQTAAVTAKTRAVRRLRFSGRLPSDLSRGEPILQKEKGESV